MALTNLSKKFDMSGKFDMYNNLETDTERSYRFIVYVYS